MCLAREVGQLAQCPTAGVAGRVEEHVAEARRFVQRQKGLIIRLRAAGANTLDAQRVLWLLESNLRRLEEHRDRLGSTCGSKGAGP